MQISGVGVQNAVCIVVVVVVVVYIFRSRDTGDNRVEVVDPESRVHNVFDNLGPAPDGCCLCNNKSLERNENDDQELSGYLIKLETNRQAFQNVSLKGLILLLKHDFEQPSCEGSLTFVELGKIHFFEQSKVGLMTLLERV